MAATMTPQQYCLRWKHHHSNVQSMFAQLLEKERFCDVTLYCSPSFVSQVEKGDLVDPESIKGVSLRAHRVVLAACSELLGSLLAVHEPLGEPVLVIDGAAPAHVRALLAYMYTGEMSVHHSQLPSLLKTAEELKIKGLTDIRWNNKDEPPDCHTGAITTTTSTKADLRTYSRQPEVPEEDRRDPERSDPEKYSVNGGPPPLIKLPSKEKPQISPTVKRETNSDNESQSPVHKRQRMASGTEHVEDEDRDQEWRHGNLDITAERVAHWAGEDASGGSWERDEPKCEPGPDDDEDWGDAPADIGSFLHTRLRVDGDNSCEDSNEGAPPSTSSSLGTPSGAEIRILNKLGLSRNYSAPSQPPPSSGPKSGPTDPRFTDVIKLNDYLRHGRRPQFWEEDYVKRVMEAIRLKELEMKQAAEILGVSYGTLYGRYRDAYGCINRPFRSTRELWSGKSSSEVLERLKRGDIPMDVAAQALGVSARDLYVHFTEMVPPEEKFEPIPIEIDPSLRLKTSPAFVAANINMNKIRKSAAAVERAVKRVLIGSLHDEEIPATVISAQDCKRPPAIVPPPPSAGRWRMNLDSSPSPSTSPAEPLSGPSTSPTLLMKSRPDLTIVAAKKPEGKREEANGT